MSPFTPALRLHDRYVLRARIGLGGMSEVWRADDEVLHRPVAVKALATELTADPHLRATIQREARAAARLTHPHVTQVYDYGEATLDGGTVVPYLVMELVDGDTLADRLAAGPLAWPAAVRMAGQVAGALAAAHRIGVVHRDIKPGNVMLTETGAKVLDFGIAAVAGPRRAGQTGEMMMGTPAYFAPERLAAGPPHPGSDVYALGALLYRTLTGEPPYPVRTWEDAQQVHARQVGPPLLRVPGLPAEVATLTLACLSADPGRRPTAAHLAERFGVIRAVDPPTTALPVANRAAARPPHLTDGPAAVHPPTLIDRPAAPVRPPAPTAPASRGNRPLGVLVAVGLALLVALVGLFARDTDPPSQVAPTTPPAGATPAGQPSTGAPSPTPDRTTTSAPPPDVGQVPVSLRQFAAAFGSLLDRAEAVGAVDPDTADDLRDKLADLDRGKPKDRGKRIDELRKKVTEAAEKDELNAGTADDLLRLLDAAGRLRGGRGEG
ncbi:protein kinase [Micromonospora sp. PLK6-60]|uniref:serine/threonine-protein kinase n=1 Tax=Micromonospora sp. PLK6-60 TaxID=2873383 RepID=UPI001CA6A01B|nr:serine/threonine-protein kinase [Micromonospora sp. PLK6-60]MBY8874607.1 protein kinase [Micromonospora sp. PLK6-60]